MFMWSALSHLNVVYTRLSDPSIDQQMRYLVKLDALHPKMSHFSSFKANVCQPYCMALMTMISLCHKGRLVLTNLRCHPPGSDLLKDQEL